MLRITPARLRKAARRRRRARGFTFVEVIVSVAVMAILAMSILPSLSASFERTEMEATVAMLVAVRDAIFRPGTGSVAFYQRIGANAGKLSELTNAIVSGNAAVSDNSCGNAFNFIQAGRWTVAGPFLNVNIDSTGLALPIGTAQNDLVRVPANGGPGVLEMSILSVKGNDADLLDRLVDNGDGNASGSIRWSVVPVGGRTTVIYRIPINGAC